MPREKRTFVFISLLWLLTLGSSCNPTQPSKDKVSRDQLVISSYQKPSPINPFLTSTTVSANLIDIIFDGLTRPDEQLLPQPHLAESWKQSQDGLVWTFQLKKGIKFHDGSTLTAEDAVFTYEAIKDLGEKGILSYAFQEIAQITVKGKYILQIKLKKPLPSFLQTLYVGILPKHLYEGSDLTNLPSNQDLVGTGSYKLQSWSEQEIRLEAHEDYFLGKPEIDEILVKIYPNQAMVWAKLMTGEIDYYGLNMPSQFEVLQQVPHFNFYSISKPYYYLVLFNVNDPIFEDFRVRKALNYAVNTKEILTKILKGRGKIAKGTIYPDSWAFNSKLEPYPYRPQKALALLKEAGWEDHDKDYLIDKEGQPFRFTIHLNVGDELKKKVFLLVQQQLLDIGIQVDVIFFEATKTDFLFDKAFQATFLEIFATGEPDSSFRFWHASQIENGFNVSSYNNPEVNRLLEAGRTEMDLNKRKALYFKYQEEILKDPPGIFLFWTDRLVGINQRFKAVKINPIRSFLNIHEWFVQEVPEYVVMSGE